MAVGASATTAAASNGNQTPGCQSATWNVTLTANGQSTTIPMSVQRCVPKGAHNDEFTLTGTAGGGEFCDITVSGTIKANAINMQWQGLGFCSAETSTFTGTLKWDQGSGSGDLVDSLVGPGTWTATETS